MMIQLFTVFEGSTWGLPNDWVVFPLFGSVIGIFVVTTLWFWRKSRLVKKIHTWVLKLHKSGSAEVYSPSRELDTAVEYTDKDGNAQRPFKPSYTYWKKLPIGTAVDTPDGRGKIVKIIDMKQVLNDKSGKPVLDAQKNPVEIFSPRIEVEIEGKSTHTYEMDKVIPVDRSGILQKSGSVSAIAPVGWNERIMIHPEGTDELFDFQRAWDLTEERHIEEGGAARLLKESADIFASLKERIKASFKELWWVYLMLAVMSLLGGIILGGKYFHIN